MAVSLPRDSHSCPQWDRSRICRVEKTRRSATGPAAIEASGLFAFGEIADTHEEYSWIDLTRSPELSRFSVSELWNSYAPPIWNSNGSSFRFSAHSGASLRPESVALRAGWPPQGLINDDAKAEPRSRDSYV